MDQQVLQKMPIASWLLLAMVLWAICLRSSGAAVNQTTLDLDHCAAGSYGLADCF